MGKKEIKNPSVLPYFFPFEQLHKLCGLLSPHPVFLLMLLVQDVVGIISEGSCSACSTQAFIGYGSVYGIMQPLLLCR